MKIQDLRPSPTIQQQHNVERREQNRQNAQFQNELFKFGQGNALEKLNTMSVSITEQGEIVARRCDIVELKRYKEMIAEFMNAAVHFAFEFKKQSTMDARGRHRMYSIIKRVNAKLEELTRKLLEEQADNVAVMNAVDEIRGMLLDLLL